MPKIPKALFAASGETDYDKELVQRIKKTGPIDPAVYTSTFSKASSHRGA